MESILAGYDRRGKWQLEQARSAAAGQEAKLVAQQYRVAELSEQLNAQKTALDREQELSDRAV